MSKIRVFIKEPYQPGHKATISNTLPNLQNIVGGYIETYSIGSDFTIICNEEGRLLGLPRNCKLFDQVFVGTIIIAGIDGEKFSSCPLSTEECKELIERGTL